jgi:Leucine-rich repeat (LRR) protein
LRVLPESVGWLPRLRHLDVRNNRLVGLPESLGEARSLEKLDVRWNGLSVAGWSVGFEGRGGVVYW